MRAITAVFCVVLIAGAVGREWSSSSSRIYRITLPGFLGYFPRYLRQFYSPAPQHTSEEEEGEEWGYESDNGPPTWSRSFPTCAGSRQSPIALSGNNVQESNFRLDFSGYNKRTTANITNTGHTVVIMFDFPQQDAPRVKLQNGNTSAAYNFMSLHFHWPGEHTIDGQRYDVEMHMVHTRDPSDTSPGDSMLVLGYVFQVGSDFPPGMEVMADSLLRVREVDDSTQLWAPVAPGDFMSGTVRQSKLGCNVFLYPGSLTTPPCTESVTWVVNKSVLYLTRSQLIRLRNFVQTSDHHTLRNNYRPVQPLNGRTVQYKSC